MRGRSHWWKPRRAVEADGSKTTVSCHQLRYEVSLRCTLYDHSSIFSRASSRSRNQCRPRQAGRGARCCRSAWSDLPIWPVEGTGAGSFNATVRGHRVPEHAWLRVRAAHGFPPHARRSFFERVYGLGTLLVSLGPCAHMRPAATPQRGWFSAHRYSSSHCARRCNQFRSTLGGRRRRKAESPVQSSPPDSR